MTDFKPIGGIIMLLSLIPIFYSIYLITEHRMMQEITPSILTSVVVLLIGGIVRSIPRKS